MQAHSGVPHTLADYLNILGGISSSRVHLHPSPGTATHMDWQLAHNRGVSCELVDGTLVDKAMGWYESLLACCLICYFGIASGEGKLGVTSGEQGFINLGGASQIRAPDVAFYSWSSLPSGKLPTDKVPELTPDIAVEIISQGNTIAEMVIRRKEYLFAGTKIVWLVDPSSRSVAVYTAENTHFVVDEQGTIDGGEVLLELRIEIAKLFEEVDGNRREQSS